MNLARNIDALLARGATFAAFRLPGRRAQAYMQHGHEANVQLPDEPCFLLAPFRTEEHLTLCIRPDVVLGLDAELPNLDGLGHHVPIATTQENGLDRVGYGEAVRTALSAIQEGRLEKVVLARTVETDLHDHTPGALFETAARAMPDSFIALARTDSFGLWLGASPERLLARRGNLIEIDAMAGTMSAQHAPDLAADWGMKERDEQAVVTRMIMAALEKQGMATARAGEPSVRRAGPVAHLHTRITNALADPDVRSLAHALHPTPAVGGWPIDAAMKLIAALEPRNRSLYGGYWGVIDQDHADLFVNIRCMEIAGDRAILHVGAGITAGSDPERECDEVERKARTWLDLIEAHGTAG